jgi:Trk K+ transport system NAD-binding subunit
VVAVVRNGQPVSPSGAMRFAEHDHVILIAREGASEDCAGAFIG